MKAGRNAGIHARNGYRTVSAKVRLRRGRQVTIMCPKSEPDTVRDVARRIDGPHALYALVETVAGVPDLRDMATVRGLHRLAFGNINFGVDAGITVGEDEMELAAVRTMFVLELSLAGLPARVDGVSLELWDQARISHLASRSMQQARNTLSSAESFAFIRPRFSR